MDIVLIAGLWLDANVWDDVMRSLKGRGHRGVPVQLPGQGDGMSSATLADQTAAVLEAIDTAHGRPMVVGHSAACSLAWLATDARPDTIEKVVFVGGFPSSDGTPYADVFPVREGLMPFPGWEPFAGPDSADLDDATKRAIAAAAIPVPEGVCRGVVTLVDQRRYDAPVVLVCPEFSPAQAQEWISEGEAPELASVKHLSFLDIDTGHWPMISAPAELARLLADAADQA